MRISSFQEPLRCTALVTRFSAFDMYYPIPSRVAAEQVTRMMLVLTAGAESAVDHIVRVDGDPQGHVKVSLGGECEHLYRIRKKNQGATFEFDEFTII